MRNPFTVPAEQFLRTAASTLLLVGSGIALLDFTLLFAAADKESVLVIPNGIGLLQDLGLFSTIVGDAILIYLIRKYYDMICLARNSKAVESPPEVDEPLRVLNSMIKLDPMYRNLLYYLVFAGTAYWMANAAIHVFGNPQRHWGHKVFDSPDHPLCFLLSRAHNAYTWSLVAPFVAYVLVVATIQLRSLFATLLHKGVFRYDLLNPDGRGGFVFVEKAQLVFNIIIALLYLQLVLHIETFERLNPEHYLGVAIATIVFVFGNRIFFSNVRGAVEAFRTEALNERKEKVYNNDRLSFDILKYCYERKVSRYSVLNILTKVTAVGISIGVKVFPLIVNGLIRV
jgi:hypothetical protein